MSELINEIEQLIEQLKEEQAAKARTTVPGQRDLAVGITNLETGLLWLKKSEGFV